MTPLTSMMRGKGSAVRTLMLAFLCQSCIANADDLPGTGATPGAERVLKTNMFDLALEKLFHLEVSRWGGGIGHTREQLVVLSGDGKLRVVDLATGAVANPPVELPPLNEQLALEYVKTSVSPERQGRATSEITDKLRYDDVLVLESGGIRRMLVSYSHFDPDHGCFTHRLSMLEVGGDDQFATMHATAADWRPVFASTPCMPLKSIRYAFAGHQSGGRMTVLDAQRGVIALALGDYEHDGSLVPNFPQDPDADYGKVWRIDIASGEKQAISIGHRNPQGIVLSAGGALWSVEHGPFGGDELNLVRQGENYGWPHVMLGVNYGRKPWRLNAAQGRHEGFTQPIFAWVPSIAPSNIDQVRDFHPYWDGDLLVFTMKSRAIHRLRIHDDRVVFDEKIRFPERIRYGLSHSPTGSLYLWTDSGNLYRVRPTAAAWQMVEQGEALYALFKDEGVADYVGRPSPALDQCLECHSGMPGAPPELSGIIGRDIASNEYDGYSDALLSMPGAWTIDRLRDFLRDPPAFAPGTSMPSPGLSADEDIEQLLRELAVLK